MAEANLAASFTTVIQGETKAIEAERQKALEAKQAHESLVNETKKAARRIQDEVILPLLDGFKAAMVSQKALLDDTIVQVVGDAASTFGVGCAGRSASRNDKGIKIEVWAKCQGEPGSVNCSVQCTWYDPTKPRSAQTQWKELYTTPKSLAVKVPDSDEGPLTNWYRGELENCTRLCIREFSRA